MGGFKGQSAVPQLCDRYSNKPDPQEYQARASGAAGEHSPCAKGHCCFGGQELGPWMTPASLEKPAGHCQGKSMAPNGCLCFPNLLCTVFQKPKLGMVFTTVSVCPAASEKGRSCEAFHTWVQLIRSWQRDAEPMSGSISSRRLWRCWHVAHCTKTSLTGVFYTLQLSLERERNSLVKKCKTLADYHVKQRRAEKSSLQQHPTYQIPQFSFSKPQSGTEKHLI